MDRDMTNDQTDMPMLAQEVRTFWLGDEGPWTAETLAAAVGRWFSRDSTLDDRIRARFGAAVEDARAGRLDAWRHTPRGWLALLILLDQFPRNIHRGTPAAFASDAKAQTVALDGIAREYDRQLDPVERVFAYLPLEHAEDIALQDRSVQAFSQLRAEAPPELADTFAVFHEYAVQHRDVIAQFGRFPHRNDVLDRASSEAEQHYLAQPGAGF